MRRSGVRWRGGSCRRRLPGRSSNSVRVNNNGRKRKRKRAVDYSSSSSSSDSSRGSYGDNGQREENADKQEEDDQGEEDEEGEEGEEAVEYRGVSTLRGKWRVTVCHNGRRVHLKDAFATAREAALAYDVIARRLLGQAQPPISFLPVI